MPSKKPAYDLIAVGESLRDVFYMINEASLSCTINKDRCLLCLEYAEKIPVQHIVKVPAAGNSANAAVGAARLGLKTAFVSWVGDDNAGKNLKEALGKEGVDLHYIATDRAYPTSEATIIGFQGERTQLVYFQPRAYKLPKLPPARCIYYSAMGTKHDAFDRALIRELDRHPEARFVFQPGTTHVRAGLKKMSPLLKRSWLFILNKDEAHQLLADGERTTCNLLEAFHHHGADTVVITDGKNGADAWDGNDHWHMPIFDGRPIERTGAGDSYAIAMTVARLMGYDLPTSLRWSSANSWSVIMQIGPQAGLLTKRKLDAVMKKYANIKPSLHTH
ncbi:MAG TPA: carbohydrate kinase family protein [Candidatus Methylomirabilis sp.]|nr:carbohydrate kinase family protein [Candidatus Methylomirabilis sp.]